VIFCFLICLLTQHSWKPHPKSNTHCSVTHEGHSIRHSPEVTTADRRRRSSGVSDGTAARDASLTDFTLHMCANWSASPPQTCVVTLQLRVCTVATPPAPARAASLIINRYDILCVAYCRSKPEQFKILRYSDSCFKIKINFVCKISLCVLSR
jgi:hypothetical protein